MTIILGCWLVWVAGNALLLLLSPWIVGGRGGAFTNGLVVVIPQWLRQVLTAEELLAIEMHERGHIAHRHALRNLVRTALFIPRPRAVFERHEHEADNYAAQHADPLALASALCKLSIDAFDIQRAARLTQIAIDSGRFNTAAGERVRDALLVTIDRLFEDVGRTTAALAGQAPN